MVRWFGSPARRRCFDTRTRSTRRQKQRWPLSESRRQLTGQSAPLRGGQQDERGIKISTLSPREKLRGYMSLMSKYLNQESILEKYFKTEADVDALRIVLIQINIGGLPPEERDPLVKFCCAFLNKITIFIESVQPQNAKLTSFFLEMKPAIAEHGPILNVGDNLTINFHNLLRFQDNQILEKRIPAFPKFLKLKSVEEDPSFKVHLQVVDLLQQPTHLTLVLKGASQPEGTEYVVHLGVKWEGPKDVNKVMAELKQRKDSSLRTIRKLRSELMTEVRTGRDLLSEYPKILTASADQGQKWSYLRMKWYTNMSRLFSMMCSLKDIYIDPANRNSLTEIDAFTQRDDLIIDGFQALLDHEGLSMELRSLEGIL